MQHDFSVVQFSKQKNIRDGTACAKEVHKTFAFQPPEKEVSQIIPQKWFYSSNGKIIF